MFVKAGRGGRKKTFFIAGKARNLSFKGLTTYLTTHFWGLLLNLCPSWYCHFWPAFEVGRGYLSGRSEQGVKDRKGYGQEKDAFSGGNQKTAWFCTSAIVIHYSLKVKLAWKAHWRMPTLVGCRDWIRWLNTMCFLFQSWFPWFFNKPILNGYWNFPSLLSNSSLNLPSALWNWPTVLSSPLGEKPSDFSPAWESVTHLCFNPEQFLPQCSWGSTRTYFYSAVYEAMQSCSGMLMHVEEKNKIFNPSQMKERRRNNGEKKMKTNKKNYEFLYILSC